MQKNHIALTIATIMSIQSIAFATQDRTAGIETQSVAEAQAQLQSLKINLNSLNQSLEEAKKAISARDDAGSITSKIAVTGAALGLGLSAVSYFTIKSRGDMSGLAGVIFGLFASISSTGAGVMGLLTHQVLKHEVKTDKLALELRSLNTEINNKLTKDTDKNSIMVLTQLKASIASTLLSLNEYKSKEDSNTKTNLAVNLGQLVGSALVAFGMTQRENTTLIASGLIVANASNIGQLMGVMSKSQAELVMNEISRTQQTISIVAAGL